jgi:integrase
MSTTGSTRSTRRTQRPKRGNGEGSISASRGGWLVAVVVPGTTRRLTARAKTKRDAAAALARLQRQANEQAPPAGPRTKAESWTVTSWLDYWQRVVFAARKGVHGSGVSASHRRRTAWAIAALSEGLGHHRLPNLRTHHVEKLLGDRAAGIGCARQPWKQASCTTVRNVLADALDEAVRREDCGIWRNVARGAEGFADAAPPEPRHAIDPEQAAKLYSAALDDPSHAAPVVALLLTTGMRPGEGRALQWGRVDLELGTAHVAKAKSKSGIRTIVLAEPALAVLRIQRAKLGRTVAPHPDAFVFPGEHASHVSEHALCRALERLCDQLSLYVGGDALRVLHPHELRHTATSLLLDQGVPLRDVAAMMGDKQETIARVYDHLIRPTVGDDAVAPIASIFGRGVAS